LKHANPGEAIQLYTGFNRLKTLSGIETRFQRLLMLLIRWLQPTQNPFRD